MTKADKETFSKVVIQIHMELGGDAPAEDVTAHLRDGYPDLYQSKSHAGITGEVRKVLVANDPATGLPYSMSIGEGPDKKYRQLELFSVEDYIWVITEHMGKSRQYRSRAKALAAQCALVHGVELDVDALIA